MISRAIAIIISCFLSFAGLVATSASASEASGDSILVLDASGSMWGQIAGEAKIAIAKKVLGDLLSDLPADRRLGLIAYGHRRAGDCADIEELAAVGADSTASHTRSSPTHPRSSRATMT